MPARPPPTARRPASRKPPPGRKPRDESSVSRLYLALRERAMRYDFLPGARINEQALGREFGVSRAPLREALNRLAAEGLLGVEMNRGFYRKAVSVDELLDLYQVRMALERSAALLAVDRATDAQVAELGAFWDSVLQRAGTLSSADLLLEDEEFHRRFVALSGNGELSAFLEIVTRRIHAARHIDVEQSDWNRRAFDAHKQIVRKLARRDGPGTVALLEEHLDMSLKRAVEITGEMASRLFVVGHVMPAAPVVAKRAARRRTG